MTLIQIVPNNVAPGSGGVASTPEIDNSAPWGDASDATGVFLEQRRDAGGTRTRLDVVQAAVPATPIPGTITDVTLRWRRRGDDEYSSFDQVVAFALSGVTDWTLPATTGRDQAAYLAAGSWGAYVTAVHDDTVDIPFVDHSKPWTVSNAPDLLPLFKAAFIAGATLTVRAVSDTYPVGNSFCEISEVRFDVTHTPAATSGTRYIRKCRRFPRDD